MKPPELQMTTQKERLAARGKSRRHYELYTEQWEDLGEICEALGLVSPSYRFGDPSIGMLLRQIADRQLIVMPNPDPPAVIDVVNERMAKTRNRELRKRLNQT